MTGIERIATERKRQIEQEGWSSEHDDQHRYGQLGRAALCYENAAILTEEGRSQNEVDHAALNGWPWEPGWYKGPRLIYFDGQQGQRGLSDGGMLDGIRAATDAEKQQEIIRTLEKSGALYVAERDRVQRKADAIAAEIDRLQRLQNQ